MAGTLFVVATPIGNLEDMTFRAVRVLREASVVAAEDTRRTGLLLQHFGISGPLISLHEHNEGQRAELLISRLNQGESVALVTDAGTPAVSDPGAKLVAAAAAAGIRVEPIPGASAVMAALSASGADGVGFTFLAFPPVKSKDRKQWFLQFAEARLLGPVVFFEAPHRVVRTLEELSILSNDQLIVFRELTKLHESVYRGSASEILGKLDVVAGEFTIVAPQTVEDQNARERPTDEQVIAMFGLITDKRGRAAARAVGEATGLSANEVYEIVRRAKDLTGGAPAAEKARDGF
jgi:16S rRNA (cytidine1402-2'-O)-methyltransferase